VAFTGHTGFESLTNLRFADSSTSIGIQVADFVASAARVVLDNSPTDDELGVALRQLLLAQPRTLAFKMIGSDTWGRDASRRLAA